MNTDAYIDFGASQAALDAIRSAPSTAALCTALEQLTLALGLPSFLMLHLDGTEQSIAAAAHNLPGEVDESTLSAAPILRQIVERRLPTTLAGELGIPELHHAVGVVMGSGLTTCVLVVGQSQPLPVEAMTDRMGIACLAATSALAVLTAAHRTQCPLSERELQCLVYAAAGGSAKTIGRTLGISPRTVEEYLQRCKSRLGTRTALTASAQALRRGWISSADIETAGSDLVSHQSGASQGPRRTSTT